VREIEEEEEIKVFLKKIISIVKYGV